MSARRISVAEACERLGVTVEELGSLISAGILPPIETHKVHNGPNRGIHQWMDRFAFERGLQRIVDEAERAQGAA